MTTTLTVLGGIVSALITGVIAYAVASRNASASSMAAITAPYRDLVDRLGRVEAQLDEQKGVTETLRDHLTVVINDRDALVAYVKLLAQWVGSGAKPPAPPVPAHLRDLLDPAAFDIARITEVTTTTTTYVTPEGDPS